MGVVESATCSSGGDHIINYSDNTKLSYREGGERERETNLKL